ncbi:GNAT family N-acetyltransferase [Thiolapillus sp.]
MTEAGFTLRLARWPEDRDALRLVRETVFVREQKVPLELEWDGIDDQCLHMLAEDRDGNPIGTGRLLPDGHIGRMAVLREWRGRGVGTALLRALMEEGRKQGFERLILAAQVQAMPFYEKEGFVAEGDVFDDAGIPHRNMVWRKT